jgi:hypothetical protein
LSKSNLFRKQSLDVNSVATEASLYAPMKLTTSGRRKLTTIFAGEEKAFMRV